MAESSGLNEVSKRALAVLGWLAILAVLAAPFGITAHHFDTIFEDAYQTLLILARLAGLIAMSLIFLEIVIGSFRPLLAKAYSPAILQRLHVTFGVAGLAFVFSHFLLLVPRFAEHYTEAHKVMFIVGPVVLVLLILTVTTALLSPRFKGSWRLVHLINYPAFILIVAHGLVIGGDRSMLALRLLAGGFAVVTLIGLAYRVSRPEWRAMFRKTMGGRA